MPGSSWDEREDPPPPLSDHDRRYLTPGELTAETIGAAIIGWAGASQALRHESPVGSLVYVQPSTPAGFFVRDFIAWCSGHGEDMVPGSVKRMQAAGWEFARAAMEDFDPLCHLDGVDGALDEIERVKAGDAA